MDSDNLIRVLTISSLSGLLLTIGLRLTVKDVLGALWKCPLALVLFTNFVAIPALTVAAIKIVGVQPMVAAGMLLLAAAPFAPVVPVFTRLAQADLALAAGLTTVVPLISAFLTPFVCYLSLKSLPAMREVSVSPFVILGILIGTILVPMGAGVAFNHLKPVQARRILRPIEFLSEITGALSLIFVIVTQFRSILQTHWRDLLVMVILFEISLWLGYALGGRSVNSRRVVALGTSNRNIALALLVALQSFAGTPVVPAVVTNGFLLILLGLLHVGWWRLSNRPTD